MNRFYLVEDEKNLNVILTKYLILEGYEVTSFYDGDSALKSIKDCPDLWILDIMLPDIDGYALIKAIKEQNNETPVIFMSARNEELDRLLGLELGSDDYLPKPFIPQELIIRTNNLFKRVYPERQCSTIIKLGQYTLDVQQRMIFLGDNEIILTRKEYDLLRYLMDNERIIVTRAQILEKVWGSSYFGSDRVVDDTLRRVRNKLHLINIESVYGIGYKLVIK